jgi:hypothetical protein
VRELPPGQGVTVGVAGVEDEGERRVPEDAVLVVPLVLGAPRPSPPLLAGLHKSPQQQVPASVVRQVLAAIATHPMIVVLRVDRLREYPEYEVVQVDVVA